MKTKSTNYFTTEQLKHFLAEASIAYPFLRFYAARFVRDKWIVGVYTDSGQCLTILHNSREWQRFQAICGRVSRPRANNGSLLGVLPGGKVLPGGILLTALICGTSPMASDVPTEVKESPRSSSEVIVEKFMEKFMLFTAAACITVGLPALLNAPLPADIGGALLALSIAFKGPEIYKNISDRIDSSTRRVLVKVGLALGEFTTATIMLACVLCTLIFLSLLYAYPAEMWHLLKLVKK